MSQQESAFSGSPQLQIGWLAALEYQGTPAGKRTVLITMSDIGAGLLPRRRNATGLRLLPTQVLLDMDGVLRVHVAHGRPCEVQSAQGRLPGVPAPPQRGAHCASARASACSCIVQGCMHLTQCVAARRYAYFSFLSLLLHTWLQYTRLNSITHRMEQSLEEKAAATKNPAAAKS